MLERNFSRGLRKGIHQLTDYEDALDRKREANIPIVFDDFIKTILEIKN